MRNMDLIYEAAHVTIVASAGTNASSGLPGVGCVPRKRQPSASVKKYILHSTLPPIKEALEDTTWATRGWKYQEGALSRRCLFSTDLQIYFVCSVLSCCEAISGGSRPATSFTSASGTLSADIFGKNTEVLESNQVQTSLRNFADHVAQYTERNLTIETDILDAFRGILGKSWFHSYFGILIAPNDFAEAETIKEFNLGFARGLFWLPANAARLGCMFGENTSRSYLPSWSWHSTIDLSRRNDFPSWSWVGWKGAIYFPGSDGHRSTLGLEALMEAEMGNSDIKF